MMLDRRPLRAQRRTLCADKGHDTAGFVYDVRQLGTTAVDNMVRIATFDAATA